MFAPPQQKKCEILRIYKDTGVLVRNCTYGKKEFNDATGRPVDSRIKGVL